MPNINEMLFKLEGFKYDKSIDLNMGYHHIQIINSASNLCMIIIPWVKYIVTNVYQWELPTS